MRSNALTFDVGDWCQFVEWKLAAMPACSPSVIGWAQNYRHTPQKFANETGAAKSLLQDVVGSSIAGYRAAEFSITNASRSAFDILAEVGLTYGSSICQFPVVATAFPNRR